ncbi:unnamed protein product [Acanthoscelides obtectus]|uniref:C2H2-type domain-containing protein n=1 Tax=Acanthoscelides obtectus TaxID=200917 RepID=A0A9P0JZN8_ACAOB|nr:unnamed protein product [Acanthoscelides obtectus]CAK1669730.1 hypothetical protein AOBTE_LOCUS27208 [Acanthoscelides obtectus]
MYCCKHCNKRRYKYKGGIVQHLMYDCVPARFICPICQVAFKMKEALDQHLMKTHQSNISLSPY